LENAQRLPSAAEQSFQEMALRHKIWLIPGSLFELSEELIFNTTPVISPEGQLIG
jgi:predicted amidohydrolase